MKYTIKNLKNFNFILDGVRRRRLIFLKIFIADGGGAVVLFRVQQQRLKDFKNFLWYGGGGG
jgi:hypothetical protein